ncbi:Multifunctional cyclase-dehydratase-3-O-methyl transferase TcmN [Caulifigura coniformis]|uniref:Multifunctional cyclase-dehydratase-3-O-methyl transferase TcmN n=1 Tax=Caulifigura coniformis TaxID=2527983 RepID=A0A517SIN7_9PLAN|nr:methyltransferase [Caulifigura coniformis]QDT55990.1 Multifunctional cyclase-dehydratase-3-O-methyl transferase TcmN [Caulifigura coniformis]
METMSPNDLMNRMITGYWSTQAIYVAAKLGIADLVVSGPRTAEDLARSTGTHAPSLYRLLRALASMGVFAEDASSMFGLTPLAECLRSDLPGSQRALAIMSGEEHYKAWGELLYSVQTGKIAFDRLYGMPVFEFLSKNVEQAKVFDAAMVGVHGRETSAMTDVYDFSGMRVLADIGGGNGSLLASVLQKHPSLRGLLYDLPGVVDRARDSLKASGVADRCEVIGGSFFESVPPGADAYLMRHIIHDWDDEKSLAILRNVHRAMSSTARLLLVEGVIPPGNDPSFGKLLDLTMLTIPGGKERTSAEYQALFEAAGFELVRIVPTAAEVSVIEGRKRETASV